MAPYVVFSTICRQKGKIDTCFEQRTIWFSKTEFLKSVSVCMVDYFLKQYVISYKCCYLFSLKNKQRYKLRQTLEPIRF